MNPAGLLLITRENPKIMHPGGPAIAEQGAGQKKTPNRRELVRRCRACLSPERQRAGDFTQGRYLRPVGLSVPG